MGFIRKTVRGATLMTVGVPLAHKRSKKDKIVRNTAAIADEMRTQRQAPPQPSEWAPTPPPPVPPPPSRVSVTDELERLAELQRRGMLTDAEFDAAKARLLG